MRYEELARFRTGPTIYIALDGVVYDVSESVGFYGPGGSYHVFAGRDATRGLACGIKTEEFVLERPGEIDDLTALQSMKLDDWIDVFESKYPIVGEITREGGDDDDDRPKSKL